MKLKIKKAQVSDLPAIYRIEKRSYPPELQATHEILRYRLESFGIFVAEINTKLVGFFTCVPTWIEMNKPLAKKFFKYRNPHYIKWFDDYQSSSTFNALYVTSTAVEKQYQGRGIGQQLISYSEKLAKKLRLKYRISVLRMPGYLRYWQKTKQSIDSYISEVKSGRVADRFLNIYLKNGYQLGEVIENYEPDRSSLNYGVIASKKIL